MRIGDYMTTYTGIQFYPFDPQAGEVSTKDIGHALSLLSRGNGHYSHFYSVAQHSINCAIEAKKRGYSERIQLACMLHDASEAYISDITRPVKRQLPDYLEVEKNLQGFIFKVYGLTNLTAYELNIVQEIDDQMLSYELEILLHMPQSSKGSLRCQYDLQFVMMNEIEDRFIRLVETLLENIKYNDKMATEQQTGQ